MKNRILLVLLAVVLTLSMTLVGCEGEETPDTTVYILTISSTEGGDSSCIPTAGCTCGEGTEPGNGLTVPEECLCAEGTEVSIEATPEPGYRFVGWTGDVETITDVNTAKTTITMIDDCDITADFEAIPAVRYDLTISGNAGGFVTSPGEGTFTYDSGTVVNLIAEAGEGYGFGKWTGDIESIADVNAASTTITVNGDCIVSPNFGIGIYDWYDLHTVRENLSDSYVLMNDLDSATPGYLELASSAAREGKGWEPIGHASWNGSAWLGEYFVGTFDGRGHDVNDMFANRADEDMIGLFGFVGEAGVIEDLGVVNANVVGRRNVGGLAGYTAPQSTISNSYSIGTVTGDGNVGGLVGLTVGATVDSYFSGNVTGAMSVGGLMGQVHGLLSNSYYDYDEVLINGLKVITAGALLHEDFELWFANGKLLDVDERLSQQDGYYLINSVSDFKQLLAFGQDSSLKFRLTADLDLGNEPDFHIPYLSGQFDGDGHRVSNLSFGFGFVTQVGLFAALAGNVTQLGVENVDIVGDHYVGGLVGGSGGGVSECYSTGRVTAVYWSGGLVGGNWGTVTDSYSTCSASGAAGLVGSHSWGATSNSYSTGRVAGGSSRGLVQVMYDGTVSDCFWDMQTSGQTTSAAGIGKTTAEMKDITTFLAAGWNIAAVAAGETNTDYIWNIVDGQTYPFLSWQP